jgi:hypothetical protein
MGVMIETIRHRTAATGLLIGVVLATAAAGQQREFAAAQQVNHAALREYSWKSRTALKLAGEVKQVRLEDVRYAFDGQLQKTVIGGGPVAEDGPGRGGPVGRVKARVIARKKAELKDMLAELAALGESYAHASPERVKSFAARATISKGQGLETGSVRVQGRDLLVSGDEMTAWIDPVSHALRRVSIATTYDAHPITIVVDYRTLDTGLTYAARSALAYPAKSIEVIVDTFDYERTVTR